MSRFTKLVEPIESRSELRVNSSAMFARQNKPPKSHLPAKPADTYTEFNQEVSESISLCLRTQTNKVFEFLNIVDLDTRFNICFPMPSQKTR